MITCIIDRASDYHNYGVNIPIPGAYCRRQYLVPTYKRCPNPDETWDFVVDGEIIAREWAIQVEHLEDLVDLCESYSEDNVIISKCRHDFIRRGYDYFVTIYDDYVE